MKMVKYYLSQEAKPTPEQIREIQHAKTLPVVPDEDCPAMTNEQLEKFYRPTGPFTHKKPTKF